MLQKFNSVAELYHIVDDLDCAELVPIYYERPVDHTYDGPTYTNLSGQIIPLSLAKDRKGVYNRNTRDIVATVSKQYSILQHGEAFGAVASILEEMGESVFGTVRNYNNTVYAEIAFRDLRVDDGSRDGVNLGVRFANSYDKSKTFSGDGFFIRYICTNGMMMRTMLPEFSFRVKHIGDVEHEAETYINNLLVDLDSRMLRVGDTIRQAKSDAIQFESREQVELTLGEYLGNIRHAKRITDQYYDGDLEVNRYDLYNIVTEYTSHADLSVGLYERLTESAERILMNPITPAELIA